MLFFITILFDSFDFPQQFAVLSFKKIICIKKILLFLFVFHTKSLICAHRHVNAKKSYVFFYLLHISMKNTLIN